ncbi:LacI family DNA-binding transcriptional regulator [Mucilaginibacter arboris]|uniref:Substrate-binding domain-containing protein n=1 Tax=Mucilaginibacter arboris TaxID=2682090 RepID=A0A7K1SVN0_9SPHI|nr:LacI family DNA-binding transcriptional regulator [Mucilaginibacter arboris]MVN21343.1 substrate-binding domain-containing protein [Mucilaginibacter arboris]
MHESITIKDIAKALGFSTSTVSRALRDSHEISAETKRIVLEYAEKINYQPNPIALSLKERKSHSIGVVVCEVANNFFSQAISGIESIAYSRGYHVILSQTHESFEREIVNVNHLASRSVDGLLVSLSSGTINLDHFKKLHDKGLPIVFFDRIPKEINTHKVASNNFEGAFKATEHLINSGFKTIAHLANAAHLSISTERLAGYKAALEKHQLTFTEDLIKYCGHGGMVFEEVETAVKELLHLKNKPDAVLITSDRLSTCCLTILNHLGLSVPDDLAIAGFTNSNTAELFNPPLTTIRQPAFKIGQLATEKLISIIESKYPVTEFTTQLLDTEFSIRSSSVLSRKPALPDVF